MLASTGSFQFTATSKLGCETRWRRPASVLSTPSGTRAEAATAAGPAAPRERRTFDPDEE